MPAPRCPMPDDAEPSHACTCQPRAEDKSTLLSLVREDRLETWFQPVFRADTLRVWGYECLARGRAIDGSRLSGGQLVDLARREDRLTFFDRVCRERHVANAGDKAGDDDLRFLINFSPTAVYDPRFCLRTTQRAAQRSGLRPDQLVFELIETEQIGDVDHLRRVVDGYRAHGYRVALDDLSAGWAGLALLGDLEPDILKLDAELLQRGVASDVHRVICEAVGSLARTLDRPLVAEGIETADQLEFARAMGATYVQGYYLGRPGPELVTRPAFL